MRKEENHIHEVQQHQLQYVPEIQTEAFEDLTQQYKIFCSWHKCGDSIRKMKNSVIFLKKIFYSDGSKLVYIMKFGMF